MVFVYFYAVGVVITAVWLTYYMGKHREELTLKYDSDIIALVGSLLWIFFWPYVIGGWLVEKVLDEKK